jgi:hypothetical protein
MAKKKAARKGKTSLSAQDRAHLRRIMKKVRQIKIEKSGK